jgi:hypothetical protein
MKQQQTVYAIVSYERPGGYRYWTGRRWTGAHRGARRYAVRSARFVKALGSAQAGRRVGTVGLLREGA